LQITLNNRIKIKNPNDILKDALIDLLRHKNPQFIEAKKLGLSTYNMKEFIHYFEFDASESMYIPRGMRSQLFELLNQFGLEAKIKDQRTLKTDIGYVDGSKISYRAYQQPAVDKLLSTAPEGVLVAPPGSGKTVMGLSLIPILLQPTLWITHTDRLFKQSHQRCLEFIGGLDEEKDIGLIGAGKWSVGRLLTIGMVQTLVRNLDRLNELKDSFGLIIIDEAHHCPASTFFSVISKLNPYFLYGLTATDYRRDGLETLMFQSLGPVRARITKDEVAKHKGIISPKIIYCGVRFGNEVNISNTATILKEHVIYNAERNIRIKDDVVREARAGNFCIVSSGRKIHCDILLDMIKKEWPRTGVATGKYSKKVIDGQIEAFNNNEITVLITTPELLGEGFDVDFLNRLFITTSFRTESRAEQLIGRIQRFHPDKKDALVFEYVDENIGVFANQFYSKYGKCRSNVYKKLGLETIAFEEHYHE